ncbi:MAG: hypothetical protein IH851_09350 [Armatimonadetes bacterium]|nr:hypothetical protein [Armatimonadota bacterium]
MKVSASKFKKVCRSAGRFRAINPWVLIGALYGEVALSWYCAWYCAKQPWDDEIERIYPGCDGGDPSTWPEGLAFEELV